MKNKLVFYKAVLSGIFIIMVFSACENPWMKAILGRKGETIEEEDDPGITGDPNNPNPGPGKEAPDDPFFVTDIAGWDAVIAQITANPQGEYTITIDGDLQVPGAAGTIPTFGTTTSGGLTVTLTGSGTLSVIGSGFLFRPGANQTIVIDSPDLTLEGLNGNDRPIVSMSSASANFELKNGKISGNTSGTSGGGVSVSNGTFTMSGGTISGNEAGTSGGGVYVNMSGTFHMAGGTIYGINEADTALRNSAATSGSALYAGSGTGEAQYGTFANPSNHTGTWTSNGNLTASDNTVKVLNGVLQ